MVRLKIGYVSTSQLSFPGDKQSAVHASVEGLKKLLRFDRLVARLSDWACRLLLPKETV